MESDSPKIMISELEVPAKDRISLSEVAEDYHAVKWTCEGGFGWSVRRFSRGDRIFTTKLLPLNEVMIQSAASNLESNRELYTSNKPVEGTR